jgi:hypothetical protein
VLRDVAGQNHVAVHVEGHGLPRVRGNESGHIGSSVDLQTERNCTALPLGVVMGPSIS